MTRRLAVPFVAGAVLLVVMPALVTGALTLLTYDGMRPPSWAGADNLRRLVRDPLLPGVLVSTLVFLAVAVPLRVLGALGLGLLLHRSGRGMGLARTVVYLPTILPPVAYGLAWLWLLNPLYGPLNAGLDALGLPTPAWLTEPNQARIGLGLMTAFQLGEGFIVMLAARREVPRELYELAATDGAGPWTTFRHITLPALRPLLGVLAARDAVVALGASFVAAYVVTGGGPGAATVFLPLYVFRTAFGSLRFGYAAALSLLVLAVTASVVYAQSRLLRRGHVLLD